MFRITKRIEISASHQLSLDYDSKCTNLHGHNWIILVTCESAELNSSGMVFDFTHIKKRVEQMLDHQDITNRIVINGKQVNPTAENIALFIAQCIGDICVRVQVQESEGNVAEWSSK